MGSLHQKGSRFRNPRLRPSVAGMWQKPIFTGGLAEHEREPWLQVTGTLRPKFRSLPVIASAAKQSGDVSAKGFLDCFAALATTENARPAVQLHPCFVIVSFTAATSWLSVNGFGRKSNC